MLNSVTLQGNLVREAEIYSSGDFTKANFTLAVNNWKKKDGTQDVTWAYCEVIQEKVKIIKMVEKGQQIIVQGRLKTSSYENKEGQKVNKTHILVNEIHFTPKKEKIVQSEPMNDSMINNPEINTFSPITNDNETPW